MESSEENRFDLTDVNKFLDRLFNRNDSFKITLDKNVLIITVTNSLGKPITKARVPVNIKNNDILGWYCEDSGFCLLPIRDKKFMLKNGCGKNKAIRPLHATF